MLITRFTKMAVVGVVATVVAGGAALAVTGGSDSGPKRRAADRANHAIDRAAGAVPGAEGGVGGSAAAEGAGSATSADGSASGSGAQANASTTGAGGATSVGAGANTGGGPGAIGGGVGGGNLPGQTPTPPPGTGGGSPGDTFTPPAVPTVDLAPFKEGSHTVLVPGTAATTKKLCLSGNVDRCRNITVPAVKAVSMTVSYSANTSTSPPTFTAAPCTGGLAVTVDGISAGANVTVRANGLQVSRTVERGVSQSASLCDA